MEKTPEPVQGRAALEALNFFMADMQAGIGPFLGVFLHAHGWRSGMIGFEREARHKLRLTPKGTPAQQPGISGRF
jgi:hypothetical protein